MTHPACDCRSTIDDLGWLSEAHTKHRGQSGRGVSNASDDVAPPGLLRSEIGRNGREVPDSELP
jgi:hypothetical protein